jgi:hypothetical protein
MTKKAKLKGRKNDEQKNLYGGDRRKTILKII